MCAGQVYKVGDWTADTQAVRSSGCRIHGVLLIGLLMALNVAVKIFVCCAGVVSGGASSRPARLQKHGIFARHLAAAARHIGLSVAPHASRGRSISMLRGRVIYPSPRRDGCLDDDRGAYHEHLSVWPICSRL